MRISVRAEHAWPPTACGCAALRQVGVSGIEAQCSRPGCEMRCPVGGHMGRRANRQMPRLGVSQTAGLLRELRRALCSHDRTSPVSGGGVPSRPSFLTKTPSLSLRLSAEASGAQVLVDAECNPNRYRMAFAIVRAWLGHHSASLHTETNTRRTYTDHLPNKTGQNTNGCRIL